MRAAELYAQGRTAGFQSKRGAKAAFQKAHVMRRYVPFQITENRQARRCIRYLSHVHRIEPAVSHQRGIERRARLGQDSVEDGCTKLRSPGVAGVGRGWNYPLDSVTGA